MFKYFIQGCIFTISLSVYGQTNKSPKIKPGLWTGKLQLTQKDVLPFEFKVSKEGKNYNFFVINGTEQIQVNPTYIKDSVQLEFPSFNSRMIVKTGKKEMTGYWQNLNKGTDYKIPLKFKQGYSYRFTSNKLSKSNQPSDFDGRWECTFDPNTTDEYKAVGIFNQKGIHVSGTYLTETGDYRFLDGNVIQDSLYLSCFDGSHAFLFTGHLKDGKINGSFLSGKHWQTTWTAIKNDNFELTHPDSLTYLVKSEPFEFTLKDLKGSDFHFPNPQYENKVTIIQIMGTWCPNCLDETMYLKELYDKNHAKGLEVISIGYEVGNSFEEYAAKIEKLKNRLDLDFTFLVGGSSNKSLVSQQFSMLNQIISFPTAIIIGRDGKVRKIHTGFNGPGTGAYYTDFVKENDAFIQQLLNE